MGDILSIFFKVAFAVFAFCIAFVLPIISAIKSAIIQDKKERRSSESHSSFSTNNHAHLRNTILIISTIIVFLAGLLAVCVWDTNKRHNEELRFYKAIHESSELQDIEYDDEDRNLIITFENGESYLYANVPSKVWQGLYHSDSIDEYYYQNIRGQYPSMKLD